MKNFLLLLALLGSATLPLNAQNWFQNHPHWVNAFSFGFQGPGYESVMVESDTLLQGLSAVTLKRWFSMTYGNDFVDYRQARQHGDTVWVWNHSNQDFYIHYNFSLAVGDSVIGPLAWGAGQFRYYIDSVGTLVAGGQTLRFQQVHFYTTVNHDQCNALAIETIGFIHGGCNSNPLVFHFPMGTHLLVDEPNEGAVDGPDWQFCHYQNDHLQYQYTSSLCDGLISQQEPTADLTSFRVQPNPFHDGFSVESGKDQTSGYLRVFDTAGRLVLQASSPFELVPTKAWPQGLYFLEITAKNGSRQFCKAWKE